MYPAPNQRGHNLILKGKLQQQMHANRDQPKSHAKYIFRIACVTPARNIGHNNFNVPMSVSSNTFQSGSICMLYTSPISVTPMGIRVLLSLCLAIAALPRAPPAAFQRRLLVCQIGGLEQCSK